MPLGLEAHACQHGRSLGGDLETSSPTRPHLGPVPQPRAPVLHPGDNRYSDHPQGARRTGDITGQSSSRAFPRSVRASQRLSFAAVERRSGGSHYGVPARVVREGLWKLLGTGSVLAKTALSFSGDFARHSRSRLHSGADSSALRGPAQLASIGLGGRSHAGRECQGARHLTAPVAKELETCSCTGACSLLLFLLGYVGHSPTKARAPAYTFRGTKPPAAESCGPGPCYFVEPAITRNGKYVAPGAHLRGRPTTETTVTPGPSEYLFCSTSARQDEHAAFALGQLTP